MTSLFINKDYIFKNHSIKTEEINEVAKTYIYFLHKNKITIYTNIF